MDNTCNIKSYSKCQLSKYKEYDECILHCSKELLSTSSNPYFKEPKLFYNRLLEYIIDECFKVEEENEKVNRLSI